MTESEAETEDDVLARIEAALQKIAAAGKGRGTGAGNPALARALDSVIGKLKLALDPEPARQDAPPATQRTE